MRIAVKAVQLIVGFLFIISGLVKANDPIGLSYKMQEFFELWLAGFSSGSFVANALAAMHGASLGLSIFMITLEIVAGVALLLGWRKRAVLWLLLALIVFFTFLTGYAYLSGKFTNCGCFGDCLPITPFASFLKDIALLALIVFLLIGQKHIRPVLTPGIRTAVLSISLIFSLALQWYVLNNLPIADCLPFKKGNNLSAQMKPPPGAVPDSFAIRFIYEKEGKQYEFAPESLPDDFTTYKFIDRKQTLIRKGNADAPIKGFTLTNEAKDSITGNTVDYTSELLSATRAIIIFALHFDNPKWVNETKPLIQAATKQGIPVAVASSNFTSAKEAFENAAVTGVQFYNTDFTIVRTVARTNPTILYLENGTVVKKWSENDLSESAAWFSEPGKKD
ncbi:DoxX family protein [Flavisolibacter sp. BT320]|nr:DoxX family protein [Flavisolibacter longurius]